MMKAPIRKLADSRGQALLEFAIVLPLLVMLVAGIFDFSRAVRIHNAISNMSREGANLASRSTLDPQHIMNTLANTAQPLTMQQSGMIFITVVKGLTGGRAQIQSQSAWESSNIKGTVSSKLGSVSVADPHPEAQGVTVLNLREGDIATIVEVFYNYESLFSIGKASLGRQLYSRTVF